MSSIIGRFWGVAAGSALVIACCSPLRADAQTLPCVADCDHSGTVTVDELVMDVNIGLGNTDMSACPEADFSGDKRVTVEELVMAVNAALFGCVAAPTPTPTATTPPTVPPTQTPTATTPSDCAAAATPFGGTFEAIQKVVFEKNGCLQSACHGTDTFPQGGLDLSPEVAYENLFGVQSVGSALPRIKPGDENSSSLWLKLAAATNPALIPSHVVVTGPMPSGGLPPISAAQLDAIRLWILSGAPQTGTVEGTAELLDACLPPPQPITITPLDPPKSGQGIQFVMPPWGVEAHSEHEICFATYYDITDQVPPKFRDPSGQSFRFWSQELRQDPFSHHLILNRYDGSADDIHDPSLGAWTCKGGKKNGQVCEPTDLTFCDDGFCTSEIRQTFACIGFGPGSGFQNFYAIGGAQKAQASTDYAPGVFAEIPMKGILYWNSHAFNLTNQDATLHGRLNYYFADDIRFPLQSIFDTRYIFAANAAPYTTQTLCKDFTLPQGARLFELSSHTHKHGKHFTVDAPGGERIYDSYIYNDPVTKRFDPPRLFNSPVAAQRKLHYCSLYNNGVALDGSPDPETVTRASHVPESAVVSGFGGVCSPVACVAGKIGAACQGSTDNHSCDSTPGANNGLCDACKITGGESTENEMFILIGSYYIDSTGSSGGGAAADGAR